MPRRLQPDFAGALYRKLFAIDVSDIVLYMLLILHREGKHTKSDTCTIVHS